MAKLHYDKLTRKMPPLLGLQNQQWEGVFSKSIQWELSPEGGFQEGMGPQREKLPRGAKILEKIWLLLFPKNHKRLVFRIRESQVSDPHLTLWFLLAV